MPHLFETLQQVPEASILRALFAKYLDSVHQFLQSHTPAFMRRLPLVGMVQTLLALMSGLLKESANRAENLPSTHIECYLLFCLAWSFGGLLDQKGRRGLHEHLKTMTPLVPEDDPSHTIFNYYVEETADWVP